MVLYRFAFHNIFEACFSTGFSVSMRERSVTKRRIGVMGVGARAACPGLFRGGRLTKWKGVVASIAPMAVALAGAMPALAADECGIAAGAVVTCSGASYPSGISYSTDGGGNPTTLILNNLAMAVNNLVGGKAVDLTNPTTINGAVINLDALSSITSLGDFGRGVNAEVGATASTGTASVSQSAGAISTSGASAYGILVRQLGLGYGSVNLTGGSIATTGASSDGARVELRNATSTSLARIRVAGGAISTTGNESTGAYSENRGGGNAQVDVLSGSIATAGDQSHGAHAYLHNAASGAAASITLSGGSISTGGTSAIGLFADALGSEGSASVTIVSGSVSTAGDNSAAVLASTGSSDPAQGAAVLQAGGTVVTSGNDAAGLRALHSGLGSASATLQAGSVTTAGSDSFGVYAGISNTASTSTATALLSGGTIETTGLAAHGLFAEHAGAGVALASMTAGGISTGGDEARGVFAHVFGASAPAGAAARILGGDISVAGRLTGGLWALNDGLGAATVEVLGGTIATPNRDTTGALAEVANAASRASATATMTGGAIAVGASTTIDNEGLVASNAGLGNAVVDIGGGTITVRGESINGARATVGNAGSGASASISMTDGSIDVQGREVRGLIAQNQGQGEAAVSISGTASIIAYGSGTTQSEAARAEVVNVTSSATARVNMAGGSVSGSPGGGGGLLGAPLGAGLVAFNDGLGESVVTITGGTISTDLTAAEAEVSNDGSTSAAVVTMQDGTILTGEDNARGLSALNWGQGRAQVSIQGGSSISTLGEGSAGARALVDARFRPGSSTAEATVTMSDGTIATSGQSADGILAQNFQLGKAEVIVDTGSIQTLGDESAGAHALISTSTSTASSQADMSGGAIETFGASSDGLLAENQGLGLAIVSNDGGSINTTGTGSNGARALISNYASSVGASALQSGGAISTRGQAANGLLARNDGIGMAIVSVEGGTILTTGDDAHGGYAFAAGLTTASLPASTTYLAGSEAVAVLDGGSVQTTGIGGHGLFARNAGLGDAIVDISSGNVSASGASGQGAYALVGNTRSSANASVIVDAGSIQATGTDADGIRAGSIGTGAYAVSISGGSITGGAGNGAAIRTFGSAGGSVTIGAGASIVAGASGIAIRDGDAGIDSNGDGLADWGDANGNLFSDYDNNNNGFLDAGFDFGAGVGDDATVANPSNPLVLDGVDESATAGNVAVSINGGSVTGNVILGLGDDTITLAGGTLDGDIYGDDIAASANDGDDSFTWSGGSWMSSFYGGNGSDVVNISAPSYDGTHHVLDGGDDYSLDDGAADQLTLTDVNTDALGANILNWETVVLDGSILRITDGALQAGDTGLLTGIQLQGGSLLDGGAGFALTGNLFIIEASTFDITGGGAGAYSVSGGVSTSGTITMQDGAAGDTLAVAGNYWGSGSLLIDIDTASDTLDTLEIAGDVTGGTTIFVNNLSPAAATGNPLTVVSVGGTANATDFALDGGFLSVGPYDYVLDQSASDFILRAGFSPSLATYLATPAILSEFNRLPSLKERVGSRLWDAGDMPGSGGWARLHGAGFATTLSTGESIQQDQYGIQAGFDLALDPGAGGQVVLGFTAQYGSASSAVSALAGTGSADASGFGLGATATWYGNAGTYVDVQGQVNWINAEISSSRDGLLISGQPVRALSLSMEVGHELKLSNMATLTPQAQLSWGAIDGGSFTDATGDLITLGRNQSLVGRVGLAYEVASDAGQGGRGKGYVAGNILHDFSPGISVDAAGLPLTADKQSTWAEIRLGGAVDFGEGNNSVFGEVTYNMPLGGGASPNSGLHLSAGLRMEF